MDEIGSYWLFPSFSGFPLHILTFSMRYAKDYASAKIPTFPSTYGIIVTQKTIAFSSIIAGALISSAALLIEIHRVLVYAGCFIRWINDAGLSW